MQNHPIKDHQVSKDIKNKGCGPENKTLCWVQLGKNGPIHLKNKLTPIIVRMYVSGSSRVLVAAVEEGRDHECNLKKAPILG